MSRERSDSSEAGARATAWQLYVLVSGSGARTYAGISTEPERRLEQHNGLRPGGAKATRSGRPWALAALYGPFESRAEAQRAERRLKRLRGEQRLRWRPEPISPG